MEKLVNRLFKTFFSENDFIGMDIEIAKIGMIAILSTIVTATFSLLIALVFSNLRESTLFIIFFAPIRCLFKGYHCKTCLGCTITFTILLQLNVFFLSYLNVKHEKLFCMFLVISIIYLYKYELQRDKRMIKVIILYVLLIVVFPKYVLSFITLCLINIVLLKVIYINQLKRK